MTLCPDMVRFLSELGASSLHDQTSQPIAALRQAYEEFSNKCARPRPPGLVIDDHHIGRNENKVCVRVYRPENFSSSELHPCVLFMHGGGWALGSIESHDCVCAELASETGSVVISVDYRLAPEHPYPAALQDCQTVLDHLVQLGKNDWGIDKDRIVVAGDSSGANLAAALALSVRDEAEINLKGQALIYPVLGVDFDLHSYTENADAPMLTAAGMQNYWKHYLGGDLNNADPLAAPLTSSSLENLPPALIMTAHYDPVRDDGAAYAERLSEQGVTTKYRCAPNLPHGYLRARAYSPAAAAEFACFCHEVKRLQNGRAS